MPATPAPNTKTRLRGVWGGANNCGSANSRASNSVPTIGFCTHDTSFSSVKRSKQTLQAMHSRIGALTSPKALSAQCGSAYNARPTDTKSALPLASTASASAGVTIRPATKTGTFTASLIGLATGAKQPRANDGGWMQYFDNCGLSLLPPDRSIASAPACSTA